MVRHAGAEDISFLSEFGKAFVLRQADRSRSGTKTKNSVQEQRLDRGYRLRKSQDADLTTVSDACSTDPETMSCTGNRNILWTRTHQRQFATANRHVKAGVQSSAIHVWRVLVQRLFLAVKSDGRLPGISSTSSSDAVDLVDEPDLPDNIALC